MYQEILDNIPFELDRERLMHKLRLKPGRSYAQDLPRLAGEAEAIARPKAFYKVAFIEAREDNVLKIDGIPFTSQVLSVNLQNTHRVFPYTATCGTELETWAKSLDDMLWRYWADVIMEMALRAAINTLKTHIETRYQLPKSSAMSPGSLEDWPIEEQRQLFMLLGDTAETVGVRLTDSCLMIPAKSISGIRFATEESFESCQLCPREGCPSRRAPYDAELYKRKYDKRSK